MVVLNLLTGQVIFSTPKECCHRYSILAFSPDGQRLLIYGDYYRFYVWDIATGLLMIGDDDYIKDDFQAVSALSFSPDGKQVILVTRGAKSQFVRIWDIEKGKEVDRLRFQCGNSYPPRQTAFTPDGRTLICGDWTGINFYSTSDFQLLSSRNVGIVETIDLAPDASYVNAWVRYGNNRQIVSGWDTTAFDQRSSITIDNDDAKGGLIPNLDASLLVTHLNDQLVIMDATATKPLLTLQPGDWFRDPLPHFHPSGELLGIVNSAGRLELFGIAECFAVSARDVNLHAAPDTSDGQDDILPKDERFGIMAQTSVAGRVWWQLMNGLWVRGDVVQTTGDCSSVVRLDNP